MNSMVLSKIYLQLGGVFGYRGTTQNGNHK